MYELILIPLALDQGHASNAIALARTLIKDGGKIVALHVIDELPGYASYYIGNFDRDKIRQAAKDKLAERIGGEDIKTVVKTGHPGRTITDYADQIGADCIIVGSHKPGIADILLGSTAARVVRHANCSVHVLRHGQK